MCSTCPCRNAIGIRTPRGQAGHGLSRLESCPLARTTLAHRCTRGTYLPGAICRRLTEWRDRFLASGEAGLKSREVSVDDEENRRLKSVVANLSVDNELLR